MLVTNLLFNVFLSSFFYFSSQMRYVTHVLLTAFFCHTQLRLNASLRIGTSVAVEHCATQLTDSLTDSPGCHMPLAIRTAAVPMLPLPCRWRPMCRARTQLARPQRMPIPFKRERAECSPPSKLITRAALSARRLSRRGLGLSLCRRVVYRALPLGNSTQSSPH